MQHFVYILKCADGALYAGCTNDLAKRVWEHNNCKCGAHYTKIRRPVKLVYSEKFESLGEGRKREAEIKRLDRREKIELIKNDKAGIIKLIRIKNKKIMPSWANKKRMGRREKKKNRTKLNKRKR